MTITGRIVDILPVETGTSKKGHEYKRQSVILEYGDRYPKKVSLQMMNTVIDGFTGRIGQTVTAHVEPSSREYNGRWYTQIDVWKWDGIAPSAPAQNGANLYAPPAAAKDDDELPF